MTYDPTWIRKSPILIPQAIRNDALTAQKGSVRLDALDWGQKVAVTTLDTGIGTSKAISMAPLNNGKMFVAWAAGVNGRYVIVDSSGNQDSTAFQTFEAANFLDYQYGLSTLLLPNGNVVVAYGQDQGALNALVFKIYDESGAVIRTDTTVKTHATETQWGVGLAALPDGNFVITWQEAAAGSMSYFAIYDLDGDVVKGYTSLGGNYTTPKPAPLSDGNWIVTYGLGGNVYFRTYDRLGISVVGQTLFRSSVSQASGVVTMGNGQIVVPFQRGFGIIDRQGNVVVAPVVKEVGVGHYSVTVLPHDNIVTQYNTTTTGYYKVFDSDGNLLNTAVTYAIAPQAIASGDVATFKNGNFMLAYGIDTTSNSISFVIHEGTRAGFGGDLTVDGDLTVSGALGLSTGTTVNEISTDVNLGTSDDILITQKAAKAYVDSQVGSTNYRIFAGNSSVAVYDDVFDSTTQILYTVDNNIVAQMTEDGLTLGVGIPVNETRNDLAMGGYNGGIGSQTALTTEYAARKYVDDIHDVIQEPTGFPDGNSDLTTTLGVDGSATVFIQPTGVAYDIFFSGQRYQKTSKETVEISDVEGLHFVYFDYNDGVLKESTTWTVLYLYRHVYVAVVYWDATNKEIIYLGDERHGATMDGKTHLNIHTYRGTLYYSGLALGDITADSTGALDIDAQFSMSNGIIIDEDISHTIPDQPFPMTVPKFYLDGAANWRKSAPTAFPVLTTGSGRAAWNKDTAGTWSLEEATDGYFVLAHVFATNDETDPAICIVGQAEYATIELARAGASEEINSLVHADMPFAEFKPVATVILETSNAFTNSVKAVIRTNDEGATWTDWRTSGITSGQGSVTDHGSLSGLGNDDHLQYFRVDGFRSVTGNLNVDGTTTLSGSLLVDASITQTSGTLTLVAGTGINEFSIDGTLVGNSDDAVPTEKAVKTYVDTAISNLNPDKIWQDDSYVQVVDDGTSAGYVTIVTDGLEVAHFDSLSATQRIGKAAESRVLVSDNDVKIYGGAAVALKATFDADGLTLSTGASVNEFSIDGTFTGATDDAVPTELAVKTYVDTEIAAIDRTQIFEGDSYVRVTDDTTAAGYIEVVADGVQVQYWDAEATSVRMGKASGAGRVTVTDNTVTSSIGASDVLSLTGTSQVLGISGDTRFTLDQSTDTFLLHMGTTQVASGTATGQTWGVQSNARVVTAQGATNLVRIHTSTAQRAEFGDTQVYIGGASGTRVTMNPTAHTLDMYVSTSQIFSATTATQRFGVSGDTALTLNTTADTFTLSAGAVTQISGGLTSITLGVSGDTTIVMDSGADQVAITAGGQSQLMVETSGTTVFDDLTVTGNLFVDGTTFVVNQTEVKTADNMITVNYGEPGGGVTRGYAGIEVDRGSLANYFFIFAENTDTFRIGESADGTSFVDTQAVATREDSPVSTRVPWWNDTAKRLDTAGSSSIAVNTSTDVITMTAASSPVATFEADGLTLASGTNINEFSIDGTLSGDSDNAVPTEKAVKTYVDAQIGGVSNTIFQGDSHITVYDDTTDAGYAEVVIDGVQVQYWDAQAASIRMGKASGAGKVTVTDTMVTGTVNSVQVLMLAQTNQTIGLTGDSRIELNQAANSLNMYAGTAPVFVSTSTEIYLGTLNDTSLYINQTSNTLRFEANNTDVLIMTDTSQTLGVAGDTNIDLDQSTDTALINAGGVEVFNATPDLQVVGGADSYITIDQTAGTSIVGPNSVEAMTIDENGLQLFTAGATINEFSTDGTLAGDSDTAVPTEKAVKTYVDAQVLAGSYIISQDDSWVKVTDDGTNVGWVEIVTDGVQVAYFDPSSATQRIGKASGAGRVDVTDTTVTVSHAGSPIFETTSEGIKSAFNGSMFISGYNGTRGMYISTSGGCTFYNGSGAQAFSTIATGIQANQTAFDIKTSSGEDGITLNINGSVELFYDNVKAFETAVGGKVQLSNGTAINEFSIDGTLTGDSDDAVPTEKAVKLYADTGDTNTYNAAIAYADGTTLVSANTYTDAQITALRSEVDLINMITVSSDTTAATGDVLLVDTTAGDVNITMLVAEDSRIIIKKKTTDGNKVNISTSSGTVDGQNLIIIDTPYQSFTFVSDGSNFYII